MEESELAIVPLGVGEEAWTNAGAIGEALKKRGLEVEARENKKVPHTINVWLALSLSDLIYFDLDLCVRDHHRLAFALVIVFGKCEIVYVNCFLME